MRTPRPINCKFTGLVPGKATDVKTVIREAGLADEWRDRSAQVGTEGLDNPGRRPSPVHPAWRPTTIFRVDAESPQLTAHSIAKTGVPVGVAGTCG